MKKEIRLIVEKYLKIEENKLYCRISQDKEYTLMQNQASIEKYLRELGRINHPDKQSDQTLVKEYVTVRLFFERHFAVPNFLQSIIADFNSRVDGIFDVSQIGVWGNKLSPSFIQMVQENPQVQQSYSETLNFMDSQGFALWESYSNADNGVIKKCAYGLVPLTGDIFLNEILMNSVSGGIDAYWLVIDNCIKNPSIDRRIRGTYVLMRNNFQNEFCMGLVCSLKLNKPSTTFVTEYLQTISDTLLTNDIILDYVIEATRNCNVEYLERLFSFSTPNNLNLKHKIISRIFTNDKTVSALCDISRTERGTTFITQLHNTLGESFLVSQGTNDIEKFIVHLQSKQIAKEAVGKALEIASVSVSRRRITMLKNCISNLLQEIHEEVHKKENFNINSIDADKLGAYLNDSNLLTKSFWDFEDIKQSLILFFKQLYNLEIVNAFTKSYKEYYTETQIKENLHKLKVDAQPGSQPPF